MEIMNKKYAYVDDAANAIASINNKIISLLIEDINKSHKNKNNKKRNMLKK